MRKQCYEKIQDSLFCDGAVALPVELVTDEVSLSPPSSDVLSNKVVVEALSRLYLDDLLL